MKTAIFAIFIVLFTVFDCAKPHRTKGATIKGRGGDGVDNSGRIHGGRITGHGGDGVDNDGIIKGGKIHGHGGHGVDNSGEKHRPQSLYYKENR